jgi:hypothetical protein
MEKYSSHFDEFQGENLTETERAEDIKWIAQLYF